MNRPHPFDELDRATQAEVQRVTREVNALGGDHMERLHTGPVHSAAAKLALQLHRALHPNWRDCGTADKCRLRLDELRAAQATLDEFAAGAHQALEAGAELLAGLERLVEADERRRASARVEEARRRRLDTEVQRLADAEEAAEEAARRERLEAKARERLATRASA